MNIGQFNARGPHNGVEHWFDLIHDELIKQGHEVRQFWLRGTQPTRIDIEWMDFAMFHFAQVAQYYMKMKVPFCVLPSANDVFPDNGAKLIKVSKRKNCKFITHQSMYHLRKYKEWGVEQNFVYVPMPVRTELFKRQTKYNPNAHYCAGGRLIPKKGLHQLNNIDEVYIFGDGPLRSDLEIQLPNAQFVGELFDDQLRRGFENSSVYLYPAVIDENNDSDGIPNTIKEAMLMRLPVYASPVAGIPELENIDLVDDWNTVNISNLKPNWKGEQEIRNLYNPKTCVNLLLKGIN